MSTITEPYIFEKRHPVKRGEPFWDIALLFPAQGEWTESEYLALKTNLPIEFSDGCLEFLPMPTMLHQRIAQFLYELLKAWVRAHAKGEVFIAPLRVRLWSEKIRMPDVVYVRPERVVSLDEPPNGADLAMEVVSPGEENRDRDIKVKRAEYARAGIQEYWIVDRESETITVLVLEAGGTYREHGVCRAGSRASSVLLPGFEVAVAEVFLEGRRPVQ
jgi:Uma2 family endonuclease